MAHPDDAEFLCAGTLIRLADPGWESHIATPTAGDCGTKTETPWAISARRTVELRQAATFLGGRYLPGRDDGLVVYDKPTLRKAFDLFRDVGPSLVFTHAPKDYMMDHEMTSLVARRPASSTRPRTFRSIRPRRLRRALPLLLRPARRDRSTRQYRPADHLGRSHRAARQQDPDARLPRQPTGMASGPSRHRRVPGIDAAARRDARPRNRCCWRPRHSSSIADMRIPKTISWQKLS